METGALNTSTKFKSDKMAAVSAEHVSFSYQNKDLILNDISFTVTQGEIFVIAGLSGCGKTTLCNIICGIIPNLVHGNLTGDIKLFGQSIEGQPVHRTAQKAAMVFQNADMQLVCTTVEDELAFGLENLCYEPQLIRQKVDEALKKWNIEHLRLADPGKLSGGQKRIVAMAAVLIAGTEILILDEPMCQLDADGRDMVKKAILDLRTEGKTVIMVEHDLNLVDYANRWMLIQNGKIEMLNSPHGCLENKEKLRQMELI